ncbi:CPBP family intramembrane glutamic endopeptidase [Sphingomonas phyllosphaerae]|uniref:CPBP family intramembrane glutamic endopeptidase n=1 Tax=Sphingomonas phyllosphaerae TaxID=257003 RepID=UPI0003B36ECA|nr:CPBP family intramembrane glutamic endopeptidase [Sphingomonas phyllosphaerae]
MTAAGAGAALAIALASLALLLHGRRIGWWPRPPAVAPGAVRHRHFARLTLRAIVHFGLVAVVLLASLGRLQALVHVPAELLPARALAIAWIGQPAWQSLAWGALAGMVIAAALERRGRGVSPGDLRAVTPSRRAELGWGVLLATTAGVTEELFFRLLLPLLVVSLGGSALLGFAAAAVLFGYAHRYQGWRGVAGTMLAGLLLTLVYLLSGRLWAAMLVHAAIDLNGLVIRPAFARRLRLMARGYS